MDEEPIPFVGSRLQQVIEETERRAKTQPIEEPAPESGRRIFEREEVQHQEEEEPKKPRLSRRKKIAIGATLFLVVVGGWWLSGSDKPQTIVRQEAESYEGFVSDRRPQEGQEVEPGEYRGWRIKPKVEKDRFHAFIDKAFDKISRGH